MKRFFSVLLTLTLILQLGSFNITTVSAAEAVTCSVTASSGTASDNVAVTASASEISAVKNNDIHYTPKNVTFTATSLLGSGLVFDHWEDGYKNNISQSSVYTQAIAADVNYKAYYTSYAPDTENHLLAPLADGENNIYSFTAEAPVKVVSGGVVAVSAELSVPRDCIVIEAGAIFYEGVYKEGFNIFSDNITKVSVSSVRQTADSAAKTLKGSYEASYTPTQQYGVLSRAYCIYVDENHQNIYVDYTDEVYTRPDTDLYNNVEKYNTVFNWEMLSTFTGNSSHSEAIHKKNIYDVATSKPDMITVTPQMYRMNLYPTKVEGEGFAEKQKYLDANPDYEIDYYLMSATPNLGNTWYDRANAYISAGNDPTREVLEAVNESGSDCFINYRMNDHHNTKTDKEFTDENDTNDRTRYPTHSAFWLENEDEYGVSMSSYRVLNYMAPKIRDHYYAILEELATNYIDYIDGIELDFDRYFTYFNPNEVSQGTEILSDFVARVRDMLNRLSVEHGKYLQLSVRVPGQTKKCDRYGIDALTWDERGYVDIIDLSNHYFNTFDIDIESFLANRNENPRAHGKINGEIHYNTYQKGTDVPYVHEDGSISYSSKTMRRYLTREGYYATAQNFLSRGVDGIHLFNVLYAANREELYPHLAILNDKEALAAAEKCYVMERAAQKTAFAGEGAINSYVGFNPNAAEYKLRVPDDMNLFTDAVLRLEHDPRSDGLEAEMTVSWSPDSTSFTELERIYPDSVELFEPLASNEAYPGEDEAAFFRVPMELMTAADDIYTFTVTSDKTLRSAEFALYNPNIMSGMNPGFSQATNHMTVTDAGVTVAITQSDASQDGDGYVLNVTNRTSEITGGKFEGVYFTPGKMYIVSAFAKLANAADEGTKAKIGVEASANAQSGSETELSSTDWTRVFFYYDLTDKTGNSFAGSVYVKTPGSTADIILDNFEVLEAEPYTSVSGNIYEDYDPSFESGNVSSWMNSNKANCYAIQADPFPHSGKWSGVSSERDATTSSANGLQTPYVPVEDGVYYYVSGWVRTDSATPVSASIAMQYRLTKSDGTAVTAGGSSVNIIKSSIDNTRWYQLQSVYKSTDAAALEEAYPGYKSVTAKLYPSATASANLYLDDFSAVPICINEGYEEVTPKEGVVELELTVPEAFTVTTTTLTTNVGTVNSIKRNGAKCTVTISGIDGEAEGALTLTLTENLGAADPLILNFKVNDPNKLIAFNPGFANGENNMTVTDTEADVSAAANDASQDGDGYVLSVTNRTSEIAGGKFEGVSVTPGKLYVVSAFAKLATSGEVNASMNVESGTAVQAGNAISLSADEWTRVFCYYDLTNATGDSFTANVYVTTPGSTADIILDSFELFEVEPYTPRDGNIYEQRDPSFESGNVTAWTVHPNATAKGEAVQVDPMPNSGKYAGYVYGRSGSNASGFQTKYVNVEPDTYYYTSYYVRAAGTDSFNATAAFQGQYAKSGAANVADSKVSVKIISNVSGKAQPVTADRWSKVSGIFKTGADPNTVPTSTVTDSSITVEGDYFTGYSIQSKLYPSIPTAITSYYADDFYACEIKITDETKIVSVNGGTAVVELLIPEDLEVTADSFSCNGCVIKDVQRRGMSCTVTMSGASDGKDYTLVFAASDGSGISADLEFSFRTEGYGLELVKALDGSSVTGVFKNYTSALAPVRYIAAAYKGNRLVVCTMLNPVQVASYTAGEEFTLPFASDADRVEILVWEPSTLIPYIPAFDCSGL